MNSLNKQPFVVVGGLGVSGTRVIADILSIGGIFMGSDVNKENDCLLFTRLFKNPAWYAKATPDLIQQQVEIFQKCFTDLPLTKREEKILRKTIQSNLLIETPLTYNPVQSIPPTFKHWGWKEPNSHIYLEHIAAVFEKIKYIHVVRHGLDMAYSENRQQLENWGKLLYDISLPKDQAQFPVAQLNYWLKSNKSTIESGQSLLGDRFYVCNYDSLCMHPHEEVPKIFKFLDLKLDASVIKEAINVPKVSTSSKRYMDKDLSIFSKEQLEGVQQMGFETSTSEIVTTYGYNTSASPSNLKDKTCLLVLGMHRSGTSALAGALHLSGVNFGKSIVAPSFDNPKGFYENSKIQALNDQLLDALGINWDFPGYPPEQWWTLPEVRGLEEKAKQILTYEFDNDAIFAIKDPRTCHLFPFWEKILKDLQVVLQLILIARNPSEIALSLRARDYFPPNHAQLLTTNHLLNAIHYSQPYPRIFISYEQLLSDPAGLVNRIYTTLDLAQEEVMTEEKLAHFIQKDLRHHELDTSKDSFLHPAFHETYTLLEAATKTQIITVEQEQSLNQYRQELMQQTGLFYKGLLGQKPYFLKVIVDTGDGFTEKNAIIRRIDAKQMALEIVLSPRFERISQLKIIIANAPCIIQLSKIQLVASEILAPIITDNAYLKEGSAYYFDTAFPAFSIVCEEAVVVDKLELTINYEEIGDKVGLLLAAADIKRIKQEKDKELSDVRGSLSFRLGWLLTAPMRRVYDYLNKERNSFNQSKAWLFFQFAGAALMSPFGLLKQLNLQNFRVLLSALRREDPATIARNFGNLIRGEKADTALTAGATLEQEQLFGAQATTVFDKEKAMQEWTTASLDIKTLNTKKRIADIDRKRNQADTVLFIVPTMPEYDTSSGGKRATRMLQLLADSCDLYLFTREIKPNKKYVKKLRSLGVQIVETDRYKKLKRLVPKVDVLIFAWYYTWHDCTHLLEMYPTAKVIIDSVDIHWVREERSIGLLEGLTPKRVADNKTLEIEAYSHADLVWAVTDADKQAVLEELPKADVRVVSNIHNNVIETYQDSGNNNILFFGGYGHYPNISAVQKLALEIFPKVRAVIPDAQLIIAGSKAPKEVIELGTKPGIKYIGFVEDEDVIKLYKSSFLCLVPLLAGAGIKGKICEAIAYRIPVITNGIGNEGINLISEKEGLITEDIDEMAQLTVRAMRREYDFSKMTQLAQDKLSNIVGTEVVKERMLQSLYREISICIVTWNKLNLVEKCINSIIENTKYPHYKILVHSNGCSDGTQDYLRELALKDKRIIPILSPTNEVFVRPNNNMMRLFPTNDVVLVNNDVLVTDNWLTALYEVAYSSRKIGVVGSKVLYPDGTLQEFGSELYSDETGRNIGKWDKNPYRKAYSKPTAVGYVSGCSMYIKRSTIKEVGVFDEQFHPCYCEDSDYCYSAWEKDIVTVVAPDSVIVHFEGGTSGTNTGTGFKKYQVINMKKFWRKHKSLMPENEKRIKSANILLHKKRSIFI